MRARPDSLGDQAVGPISGIVPGDLPASIPIEKIFAAHPLPEVPRRQLAKKKHTYIWTCVSNQSQHYFGVPN
jgi:hypothetical protein